MKLEWTKTNMQKNCSCVTFFCSSDLNMWTCKLLKSTFVADDMRLLIHRSSTQLHWQSVEPILMITVLHCAPDKHSLMHSSTHRPQFIFIWVTRAVVYINILPDWIPFNNTAMWIEKRSWQFLNYLLSVFYLLLVTWEGLGLLPTAYSCLTSIRRI